MSPILLAIGIIFIITALILIQYYSKKKDRVMHGSVEPLEPNLPQKLKTIDGNYPIVIYSDCIDSNYEFSKRHGRKGFSEDFFETFLRTYFENRLEIRTDCYLEYDGLRYEPDFTLIYSKGIRKVVVDLEIDEPYEGIADINNRKPIHVIDSYNNRNRCFAVNGWNVLRFSEHQIVKYPVSCCKYIAEFLCSIDPEFIEPVDLRDVPHIEPEESWTEKKALRWSFDNYREKYLNIESFPIHSEDHATDYECIYVAPDFKYDKIFRKIINIPDYSSLRVIDRSNKTYQLVVINNEGIKLGKDDAIKLIKRDTNWLDKIGFSVGEFGRYSTINMTLEEI